MEKPKYLSAINISLHIIIIILTILKLVINFTETVYKASVICDIIFNFIVLICAILFIILYKISYTRFIFIGIIFGGSIATLITSIFSYSYILNDSKMRGIYNFISYSKIVLSFAAYYISITDDDYY